MSLAKKCERCGNLYMLDEWDFWIDIKTSEGESKKVYIANPAGVAICSDCQKSFARWWSSIQSDTGIEAWINEDLDE